MVRLVSYCSYTGSKVGFRMGYVDVSDAGGILKLKPYDDVGMVSKVFEKGCINSAYGTLPGSHEYCCILKHNAKEGHLKIGDICLYLNLAFIFYDYNEFKIFISHYQSEKLWQESLKFLKIEASDSEFGLRIDSGRLMDYLNVMKKSSNNSSKRLSYDEVFKIISNSNVKDYSQDFMEYFEINSDQYAISKEYNEYRCLKVDRRMEPDKDGSTAIRDLLPDKDDIRRIKKNLFKVAERLLK